MKKSFLQTTILFLLIAPGAFTQASAQSFTTYKAELHRADGENIVFNFDMQTKPKPVLYVINGSERMRVDSIQFAGDSVFINMPLFESSFRAKVENNTWQGTWFKQTSKGLQTMPFTAAPAKTRFEANNGAATANVTGRWKVNFASDSAKGINAVADFKQTGNKLTGSFVTTTGDYRFLEGIVTGNQLKLSCFDGSHSFLFTADVKGNQIINGMFYSGPKFADKWTAVKNANATIPQDASAMYIRPGEDKLDFAFPDLDSNIVSITDKRFANKVVVIQLMGSWCPNCMDESAFLGDYYRQNKQRGVEVLALAYEYGTDFNKARNLLQKFKKRMNVTYPVLFTGVTVTDSLRTEKTLPQVTPIKVFPSSIVLDKKGRIRKLDNGFSGPGTGEHYTFYKKEFNDTIDKLLAE